MILSIMTICMVSVAQPIDDCIPPQPPLYEMPLVTTWYDPALGGVNCDGWCDRLSLVPMSPDLYGLAAACPAEFVGQDVTAVISHPAIGERACLDRGGAINIVYSEVFGMWVIHVDLLEAGPHESNWKLLYGWSREWLPVGVWAE